MRSPGVRRLVMGAAVALAGWAVAAAGLGDVSGHPAYLYAVTALLALGLYGSAHGIAVETVAGHVRTVVLAVTVGVLLKTALIAAVMFLVYREPAALPLGLAVAQIDPLSVSALMSQARMSERARSLLLAWASFDDPVTALLTVYLSALVLGGASADLGGYLGNLALNLGFAAVVFLVWLPLRRIRLPTAVAVAALVALLAVATAFFLVLGVALVGLFFRPRLGALLDRSVTVAFYLAVFATGALLAGGVEPGRALVLGLSAFGAQIVVGGLLITRGLAPAERVGLALGQQNGITAILLALTLVPLYPAAVAVIAPAVLVVNVLHLSANAAWDRLLILASPSAPRSARAALARRVLARVPDEQTTADPATPER
ncbi:hypothetical protein GCM10007964_40780 [Sphaerisporangium melleum]|uniref:Cation/H+ exchanger domain-containing protein n=1 Tax=Sphaerisporangium melleum TaxID=321316 RepID=A0A917R7P0_9ACTN|nr:hypothetical protein GCM10007964_40780 [Sphaerisporangium melleum]